MGENTACGGFSVYGQYDFLCGAAGRFYIGKTPDFHLLSSKMGASTSDAIIRGRRSHSFYLKKQKADV